MDEIVRKDILNVLNNLFEILKVKEEKDIFEIKQLSDKVIHNASIFQDGDSVSIAILVYSLSKIIERVKGHFDYQKICRILENSIKFLQQNDEKNFRFSVKQIFRYISIIDAKLKMYIGEVINQAEIKKGSKLYAHGISAARAAEILGVTQWDLLDYIGKTALAEKFQGEINVKKRLAYARKLFI